MGKSWEADFRFPAIQASLALVGDNYQDDIFDYGFSFCLPVNEKPVATLITPGRIMLLFLVLGIAGLVGGAVISSIADINKADSAIWISLAALSSVSGIFCLFAPAVFQSQINSWCLGERGKALLNKAVDLDTIAFGYRKGQYFERVEKSIAVFVFY